MEGIDQNETFALPIRFEIVRALVALAASLGWELDQTWQRRFYTPSWWRRRTWRPQRGWAVWGGWPGVEAEGLHRHSRRACGI